MLSSVQYMRGVAAMMVVVYHLLTQIFGEAQAHVDHHIYIFSGGVDLFFVISGFVMFHATAGKSITPGQFLHARLLRIAPLYWLTLLFVLALALLNGRSLPPLHEVLYSFAFIPYTMEDGVKGPLFNPGWTLNYEMFFYVFFAAALLVRNWRLRVALVTIAFGIVIVLKPVLAPLGAAGSTYANGLLTEFLMGMFVGILFKRGIPFPKLLIALGLVIAVGLMESNGFKGPRMLYAGLPAALILAGLLQLEMNLPSLSLLGLIGDSSYSLYLSHSMVIDVVEHWVPLKHAPVLGSLFTFALSVLIGIGVYLSIEKPLMHKLKSLSGTRPTKTAPAPTAS